MKKLIRADQGNTRHDTVGADALWSERWQRLGAANEAARRERLRALTIEGAIQEFENLCREVHAAFDGPPAVRSHPVGLIKYMRGERPSR